MLSPEAQGSFLSGQIEVRLEAQKKDRLDFDDNTTKNSVDRADTPYSVTPITELGLFKRLDLYYQPHLTSPGIWGLKLQVLGKTKNEADKGNFSTSLIAGVGGEARSMTSSGDLTEIFTNSIKKVEINTVHREAGIISGYRWSKDYLQYANAVYTNLRVEGQVTNQSETLREASFNYRQDGMIYSTGLIRYFDKQAHWKIDYSHFTSDWTRTQKQTVNSLSCALGFNW